MKNVLSEFELGTLDQELYDQVMEMPKDRLSEMVRPTSSPRWQVFPIDGYESWQERWFRGTGVRPKGW